MRRAHIVIAGAGPAGVAAAVQCARLGVPPLLVDRRGRAGGTVRNAFEIANHPGLEGPIGGAELARRLQASLERLGIEVETAEVCAVEAAPEGFRVACDRFEVAARAVVVATGTRPRPADVPGAEDLRGVSVFGEVADLLARHPRPGRVVVIGGGEAACDQALSLAAAGARVDLYVRGAGLRAKGRLADAIRGSARVRVRLGTACAGVRGGERVAIWRTEAGSPDVRIDTVDAVLFAIGREAEVLSLSCGPATPGLFLAGDVRRGTLGQAGIAIGDGLDAAMQAVAWTGE